MQYNTVQNNRSVHQNCPLPLDEHGTVLVVELEGLLFGGEGVKTLQTYLYICKHILKIENNSVHFADRGVSNT